ncbi:DNA ligase (ATP) [Alloalcanivorax xenomutans]|uniref:DNA ligase n=1 Tax=Alloalcanivorax xenomutans TaxID=1094342 RepID=UPI0006D5C353|nr:DNA ligase [Alloalcanivorax xenomutans]MBA4720600.1 DNA ligase [Alcanivorax sp.]CUR45688.1 DNA ligase (ATP) [Alloalcanivorax xenomutans]
MSRPILYFIGALLIAAALIMAAAARAAKAPALMQANIYQEGIDLTGYWVSEKLDGVRAFWDGQQLLSRNGNVIDTPPGFIEGFPTQPLDGELWMGRGTFSQLVGILNRRTPSAEPWRHIYFMAFDLPSSPGPFDQRLPRLRKLIDDAALPHLHMVDQRRGRDHATLMRDLERVVAAGGEGLMLHRGGAPYRGERNDDLLKVKPYLDAEAEVVAVIPGEGKYTGMMGALLVKTPGGRHFRLGTGFSDALRARPPAIGSVVTYKYHGHTRHGLPRFASFLRLREEGPGFTRSSR